MAYVQSTKQRVASGANALAYGSNNTVGNLLIAAILLEDDTSTVSTIVDSRSNTWTQCAAIKHSTGNGFSGQIFYAKNCVAGANTVTVTPSAGALTLEIHEYSGYDLSTPFGQHIEAYGTGSSTADSGNVTTTTTSELLFALGISNRTLTAGSGFVQREHDVFNVDSLTEDKTAGAAGNYNATETLGIAGSWVICLATFKLAPSGGISGSQKALTYSFSGVMRAGASRAGYFPAISALSVGGTVVTGRGVKPTIDILDEMNEIPNTATLQVRGSSTFTPAKGQEILIGLGNLTNRIFAGHVMTVRQHQPRKNQKKPIFDLECVDYTWQLDWKRVQGKTWTSTAVGAIASDIVSTFATAFTMRVEANLTAVTFQSNHDERVSEALSRLMTMVGGYWYVDYDRVVHIFVNPEPDATSIALDSTNTAFWDFSYAEDVTQVRTRVRVTGGASATTAVAAVGATSLAIDDTRLFASTGGYALTGANQITYTGKSTTEGPGNLTGIPSSSTGSILTSVAQGESVRVLAIVDDAAAATAIAALVGTGDGYIEHSLEDGELGDAAARSRGLGELIKNKTSDQQATYTTRNIAARSGKVIAVDLTNTDTGQHITGTFQILRVHITEVEIARTRYPLRQIEAGRNPQDLYIALGKLVH